MSAHEQPEELTHTELATAEMAGKLIQAGNLRPLMHALSDGEQEPEDARDVLTLLAELDSDRLVQLTLDTITDA